jgi:hypothetical protein
MSVIESGEEMFKDIKRAPSTISNFWNYEYTYTTSIAIPREKYNMLYSFPQKNPNWILYLYWRSQMAIAQL